VTTHIVGMKKEESDMLLGFLNNHIARCLEHQVRVRWEPGTVVLWDVSTSLSLFGAYPDRCLEPRHCAYGNCRLGWASASAFGTSYTAGRTTFRDTVCAGGTMTLVYCSSQQLSLLILYLPYFFCCSSLKMPGPCKSCK
jgi:hypothetical protein